MDVKLDHKDGDPVPSQADHKKALMTKMNNLVLAAVHAYATSTDKADYAKQVRGIVAEAIECGAAYERDRKEEGGTVTRPQVDDKGATTQPSTDQEAPPAEPPAPEPTEAEKKKRAKAATAAL